MRENRTFGSEGGGTGNSTSPSYPINARAVPCLRRQGDMSTSWGYELSDSGLLAAAAAPEFPTTATTPPLSPLKPSLLLRENQWPLT